MSCMFKVSNKFEETMKWYNEKMGIAEEWEYDDILESYHLRDVYIFIKEDYIVFEDMSGQEFYGWETSSWIKLAGNYEIIYAYYNEDNLEAEFIHVCYGKCIREFRYYEDSIEVDEGEEPAFLDWVDVASYTEKNMC